MRKCRKCQEEIPVWFEIEGKPRNLQNRKFCLKCSPWGKRNTKADIDKESRRAYPLMSEDEKKDHNEKTYAYQKKRRYDKKKEYVLLAGGKCQKCGYCKNFAALAFHHRDPSKKEFALSGRELGMVADERILKEFEKCDLLCHNCHSEMHHPDLSM